MKLFSKEYGSNGPKLLIMHGLLGSLDNWHSIATELGKSFHVFTIDLRNHGHSPHSDEFSYDLMVSDLLEFFEFHDIETASICGHSMGGKTAMFFALQHPDKVDKLIVADMGIKAYAEDGHDDVFTALLSVDMSMVQNRRDAEVQIGQHISDQAVQQFLLKNLSRNADGTYSWKMNLDSLNTNYPEIIREVTSPQPFPKPTLFIRGGNSGYIRDGDMETVRKLFPAANLVTIEGAGHWVHAEAPREFLYQVTSFLNS